MPLNEFYKIRSDSRDPNDWYAIEVLRNHIARLVDRVRSMPDAPIDPDLIAALVASMLWRELPQEVPTEEQKQRLNPLQKVVRSHWAVFLQWAIAKEADRYDRLLPPSRQSELTRSNLFLYGGEVAREEIETFFSQNRDVSSRNLVRWYSRLKTSTRWKVRWKLRDIICKLDGCSTFGSTSLGVISDAKVTPGRLRSVLIDRGFNCETGDGRLLLVLYQVFKEVKCGSEEEEIEAGGGDRIDRWSEKQFKLVTDRWQGLTAHLQPLKNPDLRYQTTKDNLQFLGNLMRRFLDPPNISTNTLISSEESDGNSELEIFMPAPVVQNSVERSAIKKLIGRYLDSIDNLDTGMLLFKYVLIDPSRKISPEVDTISPGRKIYLSDKKIGSEIGVDQATVYRHIKDIFIKLLDGLFNELDEPKDIETVRKIEREISTYYVGLLESYLSKASEQLPEAEMQLFRAYRDRRQPIDPVDLPRIHQFLIDPVSKQILERVKHKKMTDFAPEGQAIKAIDNWIESQLSQRI